MKFRIDYMHLALICFFVSFIASFSPAEGEALKINITRGNSEKVPIVMLICNKSNNDLWHEIADIIKSNLNNSGIAKVSDDKKKGNVCNNHAHMSSWSSGEKSDSVILLSLYARYNEEQIDVRFRLYDNITKSQITAKVFNTNIREHRRVAHMISDMIYHQLTGDSGYFDSKIIYIAEHMNKKRIAIMDQDGENNHFITSGQNLALTPRFSPDNKKIVYTLYINNQAKVYYHDLLTGNKKMIGDFFGLVSAPRFSPDGKSIIVARSVDGETDIYSIDIKTQKRNKLTVKSAINTSPSYSPDQKKIVFNSDRTGVPQIYVMNADGSNQKKISSGVGSYMSPVWSPKGDWIAFTKVYNKNFYIGLMKSDGTQERILTSGYLVEGPNWAPNGKLIIFTKENPPIKNKKRISEIHTIDIMGFHEKVIKLGFNASEPSWSSLLK